MPPKRVIVKDRGLNQIIRNMAAFDGANVVVGFQGTEGDAVEHDLSDLTNTEIAFMHEFGAPAAGIPERSIIRGAFDQKVDDWTNLLIGATRSIYDDSPAAPIKILGFVGEKVRSDMVNRINQGIPPPLKAATIARKGSSTPLVDTKQLANSITPKVRLP